LAQFEKILQKTMSGVSDSNIRFSDLCNILEALGFILRTKGGHFIYYKDGIEEIINLQPLGNKAKDYQVRQVRNIILKYKLGGKPNV